MSSPPFKVKAVFEYASPHDDDLHFPLGQIITVTEVEDDDWYVGEYVDASGNKQDGLFPKNFVEKYEPTAPPRPTRTKKKEPDVSAVPAESIQPPAAKEPAPQPAPQTALEDEEEEEKTTSPAATAAKESALPPVPKQDFTSPPPQSKSVEYTPQPVSKVASASKPVHSATEASDKPSGGSFRDRIAAFNKAAPPPAPFKPGGLGSGSSNFIKKPFVPPPPSKNAYIPPPREPQPQKVYKREEDPEILAKQQEDQEQAQRAGLAPTSEGGGDEEEQPKPTSLKERIALLQKQQQEQAARHAEAAGKKEKPKRPIPKKRTESHDAIEEGDGAQLEKTKTDDTVGALSVEAIDEERDERPLPKRKPSRGASYGTPGTNARTSIGDGNEADMSGAGDTEDPEEISTGRDDTDEKPRSRAPPPPVRAPSARTLPPAREPDVGEEEGATEEEAPESEEEDDEDDIDPEVRRKEELRARMAKMSGGMGMYGMFGGPAVPSAPPKKKKSSSTEHQARTENDESTPANTSAPPVPVMVPLPGMSSVRSPEELNKQLKHDEDGDEDEERGPVTSSRPADVVPDVEDVVPASEKQTPSHAPSHSLSEAPPIPGGRPGPPAVPNESRAPPPPPPAAQPPSPGPGSESDDELSERPQTSITSPIETPKPPPRNEAPTSPKSPSSRRASYFHTDSFSPTSPTSNSDKRASRLPPPIPGAPPVEQPQIRAPPPPPPDSTFSRASTGDAPVLPPTKNASRLESEGEVTEYEGDYDTDIAPTESHKDALKAHSKDNNQEDTSSGRSPVLSPSSAPPPLPGAPRALPPPLPTQPPPQPSRQSSDMPRAAPPPPPPGRMPSAYENDADDYDPYRHDAPRLGINTSTAQSSTRVEQDDDELYEASPQRERMAQPPPPPPSERVVPPPPPQERAAPPPPPREQALPNRAAPRQSIEVQRTGGSTRRSVELSRMSMDTGFVANEVDLAESTAWWTKPNTVPPVFQGRKDVLYEFEESTSSKRGGKTLITKDLYILFQDYSQTVITAQYDQNEPRDAKLEQRHEQPPARLRQDQLEDAHDQFGRKLHEAVVNKKDNIVGDGTPQGLVHELLKPLTNALLPVGTRAYGALVYANIGNASTQQNDEIRPGDIITLRNAKFQGKHGPMHAKYSMDVGKPDHVGIVSEWDGTKKKVRAWEQGRESKKTKLESFKLDDLRSGEVKIWRVMPRGWVGWQGQN